MPLHLGLLGEPQIGLLMRLGSRDKLLKRARQFDVVDALGPLRVTIDVVGILIAAWQRLNGEQLGDDVAPARLLLLREG